MKGFILGVILTLVGLAVGAYVYFSGGSAPVATAAPPMPLERQIAHLALDAAIKKSAHKASPVEANETNYIAGAHGYMENCAVCHGAPGRPKTAIAIGEFPHPPQLFSGDGVTDDPASETYWKTANGIRLTGMPGFKNSLSETEMWQISLLLANADKLPASALHVLTEPSAPSGSMTTPATPAANPVPENVTPR